MTTSTLLRTVLVVLIAVSVESVHAWSCSHPIDSMAAPDLVRFPIIFIGRVVEVKIDTQSQPETIELVGRVEVMERLRGNPRKMQELRYEFPKNLRITSGPTNSVDMGKPYLFLGNDGPFSISNCSPPLNLNPSLVSFGDGCRLYRFRNALGVTQPKSAACEEASTQPFGGRFSKPMTEDEFREWQWRELGIDWKPQ